MSTLHYIIGDDPSTYTQDYTPASSVESFHKLPRFSHHDDFSALFSSSPEEVEDYSLGLLLIGCFLISFFTVWGGLILLFKCLGPHRVGVLSGYPFVQEGSYATTGRVLYSISGILVMIFSILCITKGLTQLDTTTETMELTNKDVVKIHDEMVMISENLKSVSRQAKPVRNQLVDFLNDDICPLKPGDGLEKEVRAIGKSTLQAMIALDDFIADELKYLDTAMQQVQHATDQIDSGLNHVQTTGSAAAGLMTPFFIVTPFLLVALGMGWTGSGYIYESYYFFISWICLPLFVLMIIFAFVATGYVVLTLEANSDFCSGGTDKTPEATIDLILQRYGLSSGSLYYDVVMFYANQCGQQYGSNPDAANPWQFMESYYADLLTAKDTLDTFATTVVKATPDQLSQECGVDYSPTLQLLTQLQTYTTILLDSTLRSMDLASCENIVPLYTSAVYDGSCNYSVTAITWIFACGVLISFFGMFMIMYRGAYYPLYYFDDDSKMVEDTSDDELALEEEGDDEGEEGYEESTAQYVDPIMTEDEGQYDSVAPSEGDYESYK